MRTRNVVALVVAVAVVAQVAPAFGAPSLSSLVNKMDRREARHYAELDRRIRATVGLVNLKRLSTTTNFASMTAGSANPRSFAGSASCGGLWPTRVGGGVDWAGLAYDDYHVITSAPGAGESWQAVVSVGGSPLAGAAPRVYVVCASI